MSAPIRVVPFLIAGLCLGRTAGAAGDGTADTPPPVVAKTGPKVLVLPYQPIFRSVDQSKAQTATDLLLKELGQKEGMIMIRGAVAQEGAKGPTLDEATKLIKAAEDAEQARDIEKAIDQRKKVIEAMEKNASAISDANSYVLAHHLLARAYMWAAKDQEAKATLDIAARMIPGFELEPASFSRLYRHWFKLAGDRVLKEDRGELMVKSALPGALVTLDGRPMDTAPVLLTKTVPGKHLLGATIEGVPPYATIIDIKPGKKGEYVLGFGGVVGGDSVGDVAQAITTNTFSKPAVDGAAKAGKAAGAEFVIAGGMSKDDNHFNVHTFVIDVKSGQVRQLELVNFDLDLLTAESDVLRVVQGVATSVASFSEGKAQIAAIDPRVRGQNVVNEVNATPTMVATATKDPAGGNKAKDTRKVFKVLKGGSVQIKDEKENE